VGDNDVNTAAIESCMTARAIKPAIIKRAIAYRSAGWTLSLIAEKLNVSTSTLYRHFKELDIEKGTLSIKAIEQAKKELLNNKAFTDDIKLAVAASVSDDLAQSRAIREAIALSIDQLINDDTELASVKSRSINSLTAALKTSQDVMRRALRIDLHDEEQELESLPDLNIVKMTDEQVKAVIDSAEKGSSEGFMPE